MRAIFFPAVVFSISDGGYVWILASFMKTFYITENIVRIHFFKDPRELFTEAIKNIFNFDSLFCNILVLNQTLESSVKIASTFHNHKYTF